MMKDASHESGSSCASSLDGVKKIIVHDTARWSYFQWFLLGLYELGAKKGFAVDCRVPLWKKIFLWSTSEFLARVGQRLFHRRVKDSYIFSADVIYKDGTVKSFCIDSADSPFLFSMHDLVTKDCYFKMQCPKSFPSDGFHIAPGYVIPWSQHEHVDSRLGLTDRGVRKVISDIAQYTHKIFPLMIGPRRLSKSNHHKNLKKRYKECVRVRRMEKEKRIMAYFGDAKGPHKNEDADWEHADFDRERDLLGALKTGETHPNEKRKMVSEIISKTIKDSDARVVNPGEADSQKREVAMAIPYEHFNEHVSKFCYNMNVSGYRLSIPNRFIESFMVGTSIVTDRLAVKWYLPFSEEEVIETVPMGYLRDEDVDWSEFVQRLRHLSPNVPEKVCENFAAKWEPDVVAKYILQTVADVPRSRNSVRSLANVEFD